MDEDQITIKTDNMTDLAPNENLQIVSINDIERIETNCTNKTLPGSGIVFAPVIKVINGNDYSNDNNLTCKGEEKIIEIPKEEKKSKKKENDVIVQEKGTNSVLGSVIDFTKKIIVNKLL